MFSAPGMFEFQIHLKLTPRLEYRDTESPPLKTKEELSHFLTYNRRTFQTWPPECLSINQAKINYFRTSRQQTNVQAELILVFQWDMLTGF